MERLGRLTPTLVRQAVLGLSHYTKEIALSMDNQILNNLSVLNSDTAAIYAKFLDASASQ